MTDNAGNVSKSTGDTELGTSASTPSANTSPYSATTSCSSKSTTSMTIIARAYDREQTSLSYTLYFNGSYKQTLNGSSGVTFNIVTGLSKRTNYSWYVVVSDGKGGSVTARNNSYTNCPGNDSGCAGGGIKGSCQTCGGAGIICYKGHCLSEVAVSMCCSDCGQINTTRNLEVCETCKTFAILLQNQVCGACGKSTVEKPVGYTQAVRKYCSVCNGTGGSKIETVCEHGMTDSAPHCVHRKYCRAYL